MHKIFAKDKCVYLIDDKEALIGDETNSKLISYQDPSQLLKEYLDFTAQDSIKHLYVYSPDLQLLWEEYLGLFQLIEAAGGVVKNNNNKLLLIFRQGCWDLPKGKIERGEEVDVAAIREVQEECGIQDIRIVGVIPSTHHTYSLHNKLIIKKTFWFEMQYTGTSTSLVPQLEENITDARWMNIAEMREAVKNTYPLIREVLESYMA